ncbi:MAG: hypothetical protein CMH83_21520 [Nocardioides sp.]|nr:hypothetical protein [Nocardioides sp.]
MGALALGLAACGLGEPIPPSPTLDPPVMTNTGTPQADDGLAQQRVARAVRRVEQAGSGRLTVRAPLEQGASLDADLRYRLDPPASEGLVSTEVAGDTAQLDVRTIGDRAWLRADVVLDGEAGATPCWIDYTPVADDPALGASMLAPPVGVPPALVALLSATGERSLTARRVAGTVDLVPVLQALNSSLVGLFGLDRTAAGRVPASFLFATDGALTGYTVQLARVPDAVRDAGGDGDAAERLMAAVIGQLTVLVDELGSVVAVDPPPADEVVVLSDLADLPTVMDACGQQDPVGA